jgi:hypothetical protein
MSAESRRLSRAVRVFLLLFRLRGAVLPVVCVALLVVPGAAAAEEPCWTTTAPNANLVMGTGGRDVLIGTSGPDLICGLGGDDAISGLGGADLILGGSGNDLISGGDGNDFVDGGGGNDRLEGGSGHDNIRGGPGDDLMSAHDGTVDLVDGGAGRDRAFVDRKLDHVARVEARN